MGDSDTTHKMPGKTNQENQNESGPSQRPFTVVVEGNIGSGKSTFLEQYASLDSVSVFSEPVDKWRNLDGNNLLQLMYENPQRHSYTFQSYVQLTMAQIHAEKNNQTYQDHGTQLVVGRHVFAENLHRS